MTDMVALVLIMGSFLFLALPLGVALESNNNVHVEGFNIENEFEIPEEYPEYSREQIASSVSIEDIFGYDPNPKRSQPLTLIPAGTMLYDSEMGHYGDLHLLGPILPEIDIFQPDDYEYIEELQDMDTLFLSIRECAGQETSQCSSKETLPAHAALVELVKDILSELSPAPAPSPILHAKVRDEEGEGEEEEELPPHQREAGGSNHQFDGHGDDPDGIPVEDTPEQDNEIISKPALVGRSNQTRDIANEASVFLERTGYSENDPGILNASAFFLEGKNDSISTTVSSEDGDREHFAGNAEIGETSLTKTDEEALTNAMVLEAEEHTTSTNQSLGSLLDQVDQEKDQDESLEGSLLDQVDQEKTQNDESLLMKDEDVQNEECAEKTKCKSSVPHRQQEDINENSFDQQDDDEIVPAPEEGASAVTEEVAVSAEEVAVSAEVAVSEGEVEMETLEKVEAQPLVEMEVVPEAEKTEVQVEETEVEVEVEVEVEPQIGTEAEAEAEAEAGETEVAIEQAEGGEPNDTEKHGGVTEGVVGGAPGEEGVKAGLRGEEGQEEGQQQPKEEQQKDEGEQEQEPKESPAGQPEDPLDPGAVLGMTEEQISRAIEDLHLRRQAAFRARDFKQGEALDALLRRYRERLAFLRCGWASPHVRASLPAGAGPLREGEHIVRCELADGAGSGAGAGPSCCTCHYLTVRGGGDGPSGRPGALETVERDTCGGEDGRPLETVRWRAEGRLPAPPPALAGSVAAAAAAGGPPAAGFGGGTAAAAAAATAVRYSYALHLNAKRRALQLVATAAEGGGEGGGGGGGKARRQVVWEKRFPKLEGTWTLNIDKHGELTVLSEYGEEILINKNSLLATVGAGLGRLGQRLNRTGWAKKTRLLYNKALESLKEDTISRALPNP